MEKEIVNWEETDKLIKELGRKIANSDFVPTMIAPVPRGGWCVAAFLAQIFDVRKTVGISHRKENGKVEVFVSSNDLKDELVLLVEDSIETGKTLYAAEQELVKLGAIVKTACIFVSSRSEQEKQLDFYLGTRIIPDFPWELNMRELSIGEER